MHLPSGLIGAETTGPIGWLIWDNPDKLNALSPGMSEDALTKCPQCGKKKLRRLFGTGAAILFKGSGFYETDYRSESYKTAAKADTEAAKPADTNGKTGASETKAPVSSEKPKKTDPKPRIGAPRTHAQDSHPFRRQNPDRQDGGRARLR